MHTAYNAAQNMHGQVNERQERQYIPTPNKRLKGAGVCDMLTHTLPYAGRSRARCTRLWLHTPMHAYGRSALECQPGAQPALRDHSIARHRPPSLQALPAGVCRCPPSCQHGTGVRRRPRSMAGVARVTAAGRRCAHASRRRTPGTPSRRPCTAAARRPSSCRTPGGHTARCPRRGRGGSRCGTSDTATPPRRHRRHRRSPHQLLWPPHRQQPMLRRRRRRLQHTCAVEARRQTWRKLRAACPPHPPRMPPGRQRNPNGHQGLDRYPCAVGACCERRRCSAAHNSPQHRSPANSADLAARAALPAAEVLS